MPEAVPNGPSPNRLVERGLPWLVVLAGVLMAGHLFACSWKAGDAGWWWLTHDRHTHYSLGLNLAYDVRHLDLSRLRHDLDALRVWGPLHPLLEAAVQLVAGPDHRFAILPSVAAWVLTVALAYLVTRRLLPSHGDMAGLAAAAVVAALPAYRAYATDVMLESLGVMLTLLVLYCYLVAVQDGPPRSGTHLALALLLLFFHKYNYWLIVVTGLALGEFLRRPGSWVEFVREHRGYFQSLLVREARQPLSWLAAVVFVFACVVWLRRGVTLVAGPWRLTLVEPHNLFWVAFAAFFLRLCVWWRREGRELAARLDPRVRPVLVWHGWAAAVWFLLPKRLGYFFWFLSPANTTQEFKSTTLIDGFWFYLNALREDYCAWPWQLAVLLGLVALAVLMARRFRPGNAAVFLVLAVGAFLSMQHAMTKHRFAHTWAAVAWVVAIAGLFALLSRLGRASRWVAAATALAVVGLQAPAYLEPGRAQESGAKGDLANPLAITGAYLPSLADARHSTIMSNVPARYLFGWTFVEAHGHTRFATAIKQFRERLQHDPEGLRRWLAETPSDALVLVEVLPHSPHAPELTLEPADLETMKQVLRGQAVFTRAHRWDLPEGVSITLWRKDGPAALSRKGERE
ncbi:MAG: glycosyltransferase family 39 protein [Gemmataceae bacterium]